MLGGRSWETLKVDGVMVRKSGTTAHVAKDTNSINLEAGFGNKFHNFSILSQVPALEVC